MNEDNKLTEDEQALFDRTIDEIYDVLAKIRQDILEKGLNEDLTLS